MLLLFLLTRFVNADALPRTFPDILFLTGMHFGGYGRLAYQQAQNRYQLVDGRINSYVIDGASIRPMRPDEGGGSMANPQQIVALNGRVFMNSPYSQVLRLDTATGAIVERYSYGNFAFGGSGSAAGLFGSERALLVLHDQKLLTLDHELKRISETRIPSQAAHVRLSSNFVQDGTKLYDVMVDNPATHVNCVGPCNLPVKLRQTEIDFTNPKDIKFETKEAVLKAQENFIHKVVDGMNQGWFFAEMNHQARKSQIIWRSFSDLAVTGETFSLPEGTEFLTLTKAAPFWMVTKSEQGIRLVHVERKRPISAYPLSWVKGSMPRFNLFYRAGILYVAAGHQLALYDVMGQAPKLLLQQDFVTFNGSSRFLIEGMVPVELAKSVLKVDRARLESLLKKGYLDDKDRLALQSEVEKLGPSDTWAVDPFLALLKNRSISYQGGAAYAVTALERFGPAAERAVPDLVYACMEGASIRGDTMELVARAMPKIDPSGNAVRAMRAECVKKTYVCDHVIKRLLGER